MREEIICPNCGCNPEDAPYYMVATHCPKCGYVFFKNEEKVWIVNGYGDEGNWEIELYSTYEKAKIAFDEYIENFSDMYETEVKVNGDYASYNTGNHYDSFWIKEVKVK